MLLLLLNVKFYQCIDDELVDNKTERGTAKRAAEGGRHLAAYPNPTACLSQYGP